MKQPSSPLKAANPFLPPAAELTESTLEPEPEALVPADPLRRVLACLLGIGSVILLLLASFFTAFGLSQALRLPWLIDEPWPSFGLCIGAATVYAPFALLRIHRSGRTLPFLLLGLQFRRKDGSRPSALRILLLWFLPAALIAWVPFVAGVRLPLSDRMGPTVAFSGLVLLLANALSSLRPARRTWLDQAGGLRVVKP